MQFQNLNKNILHKQVYLCMHVCVFAYILLFLFSFHASTSLLCLFAQLTPD